ncbi:MAG TPA: hypothetical protein ENL18_03150 [Thermoplasmatales archaeon]|nr:hypothetical protein [Thermoplasmatales archaeon]
MEHVIFEIEKEKAEGISLLEKDDLVSRQSIMTRDSKSLGIEGDSIYVKIDGSEEAVKQAEKIVKENELGKRLSEKEAEPIMEKIREEEESASEGMGFIFG